MSITPPNAPPVAPRRDRWSLPMSMAEIAARIGNIDPRTARKMLLETGLRKLSRCLWRARLDTLDDDLRRRIEDPTSPARLWRRGRASPHK